MEAVRLVQLTNAGGIPRADEISMTGAVLLFTLGIINSGSAFGSAARAAACARGLRIAEDTRVAPRLRPDRSSSGALWSPSNWRWIFVLYGCGLMLRAF